MNERVIEVPWALSQLPQEGIVLDVGSCNATYLHDIPVPGRFLHCLDPQDCIADLPRDVVFHCQSLIGNDLPEHRFDAVLMLSTLEHIGLPWYGQSPIRDAGLLALAEVARLVKPGGYAVFTVPAGVSKTTSWYYQYSPRDLQILFTGWVSKITYWGHTGNQYEEISDSDVEKYDYRENYHENYRHQGAGAIAGIVAYPVNRNNSWKLEK